MNLEKLRSFRCACDLTQAEVSHLMGVTPSTYSRLEAGNRRWSLKEAIAVCVVLGFGPEEVSEIMFDGMLDVHGGRSCTAMVTENQLAAYGLRPESLALGRDC